MTTAASSQSDNQQYLSELKRQNHQAFNKLIQRYHASMLSMARSIVGDVWAEEVVQEAWVSIYKALPNFEGRSSLKTWLFTIVRNEAMTRVRKESRAVSMPAGDADQDQSDWLERAFNADGSWQRPPPQWEINSPDALLQEEQLKECLERALGKLHPDQRAVFTLRDLEQMSMEEICGVMEVSYSNARVLLHRARMKLMQVINHYQETGQC